MHNILKTLLITVSLVITFGFLAGTAEAQKTPKDAKIAGVTVDCADPKQLIQSAVNNATGPTAIFISGTCFENVSITKDDITLSGNEAGVACIKADPGGTGTIEGTITIKSARARIEFLTLTGPGDGVIITDRATVELDCNDIVDNQKMGITVGYSSHALITNNKVRGNGARTPDSSPYWDCGLYVMFASSVRSLGNTYEDNQYCAIEANRQSVIRIGGPLHSGERAVLAEMDIIVARGCNLGTGEGCLSSEGNRVAIETFDGGQVDLRNARVGGEIEAIALSSIRLDGNAEVVGNFRVRFNSIARIRNRDQPDQTVTYTGTLSCDDSSISWSNHVQCGQTCTGEIPGSCTTP